jgi:hypothetical protein
LQTGTAILSGLGLAVSSIGFIAIIKKLDAIDKKLKKFRKDKSQKFSESTEKSKIICSDGRFIENRGKIESETSKRYLHFNPRQSIGQINMRQRAFVGTETLEIAMANEEYFTLDLDLLMLDVRQSWECRYCNSRNRRTKFILANASSSNWVKQLLIGDYPSTSLHN